MRHLLNSRQNVRPYLCQVRFLPVFFLVVFAGLVFSYPISDTDIWWHLAAGREIWRSGSVPRFDPFCRSSLGIPWTDLHWGFQIAAWKAWGLCGAWGLVFGRVVFAIALPLVALGKRLSWKTGALAGIGLWISRDFLDLRPLLVTLLVLACMQRILSSPSWWSRRGFVGALLLQVVLVNTQGLFLLGPLLVAGLALGRALERRRAESIRLGILCACLVAASCANPWGLDAFRLADLVAGRILPHAGNLFSSEIPENAPLWRWVAQDWIRSIPLVWIGAGLVLFWRRGDSGCGRLVLLLGTAILACIAVRNAPLLAMQALFCIEEREGSVAGRRLGIFAVIYCAALALFSLHQRKWDIPSDPVAPLRLPAPAAVAEISASDKPSFHELRAGGWINWLSPGRTTCWADTRLVLHDAPFVAKYLELTDHPERFQAFADESGFGHVLLPIFEFPRFRELSRSLLRSDEWDLVHCDGAWALFRRRPPGLVAGRAIDFLEASDAAALRFGTNPRLERAVRRNLEDWFGASASMTADRSLAP